jgi:hypothetical protein
MKDYLSELKAIEEELKEIWKALTPSERQKRQIVVKMNRIQMTIHYLKKLNSIKSK